MVDSFIRHGAPELVKQFSKKGTKVAAKNWNTPASLKPLLQTLNPETVEALAKSATTADGELLPQTINQIADEAVVNPENARRGLGFFQDGVQNKDWGNYGAWQGDIEKKWNIQDQKTKLEAPVPEKEATPRRTDNRAPIEQMLDDIYTEGMDDDTYDRLCKTIDLEEVPQEDLWEDGELKLGEVFDKINYHLLEEGDWKVIRKKGD